MLAIRNLALRYGSRPVFTDLNLQVNSGEVVGILGQNGAGKTTLLKAILGQVSPAVGTIELQPHVKLSYLPQHGRFPRSAQVRGRDLVSLGLDGARLGFWARRGTRQRVDQVLDEVGASAYANAPISELSGGELQRLRIAAALITQPDLLLLDEPLASLDVMHQTEIVSLLGALKSRGTAILIVTHELNPVKELLDQVVYLALGRVAVGTLSQIMRSETLSELYGEAVRVLELGGNFFVVNAAGTPGFAEAALHGHHHASHFESIETPHDYREAGH